MAFDKDLKLKPANGTDGLAVTVIKNISKLRYSYKGNPAAFKSFLKKSNLAQGAFLRYVGNRLHVLFHMAGMVFQHERILKTFLESNTKYEVCKFLLQDMNREEVLVQLQALGLLGKMITGPWMKLFYKNALGKTNLELGSICQTAKEQLKIFKQNLENLLSSTVDVFGQVLDIDGDEIHQSPLIVRNRNLLLEVPFCFDWLNRGSYRATDGKIFDW